MSGTLALAAVSAVLKYTLVNSLGDYNVDTAVGSVGVSAVAPDKVDADAPAINLFLLRTDINAGWAHNALPSRSSQGAPIARPDLPLDLYYLVSAHATTDFVAEILLGYAMQIFHERPVLPRQLIRDALVSPSLITADTPAAMLAAIAAADLAGQVEQIKFSLEPSAWETMAHIWSALQTQYRPCALYKASVVLIESTTRAESALPVRSYNIYPLPFRQPVIDDVIAADGPGTPILSTKDVRIRGRRLRGDDTRVRLAGLELSSAALTASDSEISFSLPAAARAGILGAQVIHQLALGTPPVAHRGVESNVAALILQPQITQTGAAYNIAIVPPAGDVPRLLRVQLAPLVDERQRVQLLLNEFNPPANRPPRAHAIDARPRTPGAPATAQIDFPIPDVLAGDYLVRVRVDGAESPLEYVTPTGYNNPRVTLP